jgi:DNA-binding GntR family transcriptional regulator
MDGARSDPRAYMRVAAAVRRQIAEGCLAPGASLPSITVLCREHALSRQTVGKGLRLVEEEGLIYRVPGLGYFVSWDTGRGGNLPAENQPVY